MPHGQLFALPYPDELRGMICGAKIRAGTPCKRRDLYASGRCRLHGGLSTGPKRKPTGAPWGVLRPTP
ncbi:MULTISPECIES: HGGxSTG domain-containing protein [unclassified Pseudomonas]|uniref:HGGxSTG domain-containing protein n=1 Tax=Pseudomonas TaxID=286 RepID=UPI0009EDDECA